MKKQPREVPVFLFNGLLESGKTVMVNRFFENRQICGGRKIVLIVCEEGIEEYDEKNLREKNVTLVSVEDEEDFNSALYEDIERKYAPDIVAIEYNGMWDGNAPLEIVYPDGWQLVEIMTTVDSTTFDAYSKNLRAMLVEQFRNSDIVIFNRFTDDSKKMAYRSLVKAVNMRVQVVYEYEDGTMDAQFDASPFDLTKDEIDIGDADFGVFYFDVMDNVDKYEGKTVTMRAQAAQISAVAANGFLIGRFAMTCCANDIQFISIYVKNNMTFKNKAWYYVKAKVVSVDASIYGEEPGGKLAALEVLSLAPATAPEEEVVTF